MEQALRQRGLNEQSPDPFKVIPEETEGQWRVSPPGETNQQVDEPHGHGKKSMLKKMKDKAKTLRTKVKDKMTPSHGESQEENHESISEEEEEEDVEEQHQTEDKTDDVEKTSAGLDSFGTRPVLWDDNKSSVQHITAEKDPHIFSNKEEMPTEETSNLKTRVASAEDTKSSPDFGKVQQIREQGEEEKPMSTKFGEPVTVTDVDHNGRGEYESTENNFQTTPENSESGKAWNQSSSEAADRGKENLEEFGVHNGTNSPEKSGERQSQSPGGKFDDNVKETPEKAELGKSWSERASGGLGFAKETLQGYGVFKGTKSVEKTEDESQSSLGNTQDKISEIGEGKEMSFDQKSPNYTEEIKTGPSETFDQTNSNNKDKDTVMEGESKENEDEGNQQQQSGGAGIEGQSFASKIYFAKDIVSSKLGYGGQTNQEPNVIGESKPADQIQGKEMGTDQKSPNSTEEMKTTPSETGPGYVKQASILAEELKKVLSFDQASSNNKAKDTGIEADRMENKDEETQQQQSGGEGKAGQSYASKIYSVKDVISSKLGYGGQSNQEPNVIGESKPADQIQGTATESMEGAKDSKETYKSTIVSKLSPGEDDKALSDVITGVVSNSAKSLKDSLGGLYGGNAKVSTTDANIGAPGSDNQSTPSSPGGKGIVDRVTGVVGSFLGRKQVDNSEPHSPSEKSEPKSQVQVEEQMPAIPKF